MNDITAERLAALEARVVALETERWDLKARLEAAEGWQRETDAGFKAFPDALRKALTDA